MSNFQNIPNKIKALVAIAAGLFLMGCFDAGTGADPLQDKGVNVLAAPGTIKVNMRVAAVGNLAKGSVISLSKMIVVLTSDGNPKDTIRDTILAGSNGFGATSTVAQTISKVYGSPNYVIRPERNWKMSATIKDTKDSTIYRDSSAAFRLNAADTAKIVMGGTLSPKYAMYDARFAIPDSLSSLTGSAKQALNIKRLVFKVNGVTVRDSTSPTFFTKNATSVLSYDYVKVGVADTIRLMAFGPLGVEDTVPTTDSLFAGQIVTNPVASIDDSTSYSFSLAWVGPTVGRDKITVTVGKVGKVTVTGTMPGTVFP